MLRIISALVASSLLLAGQAFAAPDSVVFEGGDVRIKGDGNGLVFPDGTIQTTKTLQGPQGGQGSAGGSREYREYRGPRVIRESSTGFPRLFMAP